MRPPLRVIPGGRSGDTPRPRRQPALRDVRDGREVIEECRRRVMKAANASYVQCCLFKPVNAPGFYTYINEARGLIVMVFVVRRQREPTEYWKVFGGADSRSPEKLQRRPNKHEAFLRARAGTSPENDRLFADMLFDGPEDYYQ